LLGIAGAECGSDERVTIHQLAMSPYTYSAKRHPYSYTIGQPDAQMTDRSSQTPRISPCTCTGEPVWPNKGLPVGKVGGSSSSP